MLLEQDFSQEEIAAAKVRFPEGSYIYPYFDWATGEILRINTKAYPDENGVARQGFSWGEKACLTTPEISKEKVIILEGENDFLSVWEAGETSIIALCGNPSKDQVLELVELVGDCNKVYLMFDNDHAGEKFTDVINRQLPHKAVYQVVYDSNTKDPDDLLKKSEDQVNFEELLNSAVLLPSVGYAIRRHCHNWEILNREIKITYFIKRRTNKGVFEGDLELSDHSGVIDAKLNCSVLKFRNKLVPFSILSDFYKTIVSFYDGIGPQMDLEELIDCYKFSENRPQLIKRIASLVSENGSMEEDVAEIAAKLGNMAKDQILGEINDIENTKLDPDKIIPKLRICQHFNVKDNEAFYYYTRVESESDGVVSTPYLISNKKELSRLDLIKRKTPKSMLLLNQKYELPIEVSTALSSLQETSLHQIWVDRFRADIIQAQESTPSLLIKRLEAEAKKFFYSPDQRVYKILALWIYGTYFYDLFGEYPYLYLTGKKGTGKTTVDKFIYSFAFNAKLAVQISEAAFYRSIEGEGGTFILDELEFLTTRTKSQESGMSTLLKGGYSKSGNVYRCNPDKGNIPEGFNIYGPKVLSNIFGLDDVIQDRCLSIQMPVVSNKDMSNLEDIDQYRNNNFEFIREITSLCCISGLKHFQLINEKYMATSFDGETARMSQIMKPISALAQIAGREYIEALESYYTEQILWDKIEVEETTPEGLIKRILTELSLEFLGREDHGWLELIFVDEIKKVNDNWLMKYGDGFRVNQTWLKLALDAVSQGIKYPYSQIPKYLKRNFGKIEYDSIVKRTTITLLDEGLIKEVNSSRPTVSNFRFYFKDFVNDWDKPVITKPIAPSEPAQEIPVSVSLFSDKLKGKEPTRELSFEDF